MEIFFGLLVVSMLINFHQVASAQRLKGLLRTGLRKAEHDGSDRVRLPYNQVAELMGWKPEFKRYTIRKTGKRETYQSSVYPIKEK